MELLIVIIVIAVLAAIALPKFINSGTRSKEAALITDLKLLRTAYQRFSNDCGAVPATLFDLAATTAPGMGKDPLEAARGNDVDKRISASDWHGPYIEAVPPDPITGSDFMYKFGSRANAPIYSSSPDKALDGSVYDTW